MEPSKSNYASYINSPPPSSLPKPKFLNKNIIIGENHPTTDTHNKQFRAVLGGLEIVLVNENHQSASQVIKSN